MIPLHFAGGPQATSLAWCVGLDALKGMTVAAIAKDCAASEAQVASILFDVATMPADAPDGRVRSASMVRETGAFAEVFYGEAGAR